MEVKICPNCEGQGHTEERETRSTDHRIVQCQRCYGSGRVLTKTYSVEVPFGCNDLSGFYEADETITKTIRNINL